MSTVAAPPDAVVLGILLAASLAGFVAAIGLRDFVRSVLAFALGSAILAGAFALLAAPYAAVLELTVGAGLTAVLFLTAITLTTGREDADG